MSDEPGQPDVWKRPLTRRQLLGGTAAAVAGLGTAAILGCSDDEETGGAPSGGTYTDPGISDTEVKIGTILPITGPILGTNALPNAVKAYVAYVNAEKNGINGRKLNLIILDGQYNPPVSLELARRLVEQDQVFALAGVLGTPINAAIMPYMEGKNVPNILIFTGSSVFLDPVQDPLAMMGNIPYVVEGGILGAQIIKDKPDAKVAVLRQNDSLGESYLEGLRKGMGAKASQIVSTPTFEVFDTSAAAQVLAMKNAGADVLFFASTLRMSILATKEAFAQGWKPRFVFGLTSGPTDTINAVDKAAMKDTLTAFVGKDPRDPAYANDKAILAGKSIIQKYEPGTALDDPNWALALAYTATLVEILRKMKTPTRKGLLESARSLKGFDGDEIYLPGVSYTGSAETNATLTKERFATWDGAKWVQFGDAVDGSEFLK